MLRLLMWRLLALLALMTGLVAIAWFLHGGPGKVLRGAPDDGSPALEAEALARLCRRAAGAAWRWSPGGGLAPVGLVAALGLGLTAVAVPTRWLSRRRRRYVRLRVEAYRTDRASHDVLVTMFEVLHKRLLRRWWRRLYLGQPAVALEVHHTPVHRTSLTDERAAPEQGGRSSLARERSARLDPGSRAERASSHRAWLAVSCPVGLERMIEAALQSAYPNCRLCSAHHEVGPPPVVLRLKKHAEFIKRAKALDGFDRDRDPPVNRLMTAMGACAEPSFLQVTMTPAPAIFERFSKHLYRRREARLSRMRREHLLVRDRSMVEDVELRGGLELQHRPLFFTDLRVIAPRRATCERIASELRADGAENRLVERGTAVRHGLFGLYDRRVRRGEGNPMPSFRKGVLAPGELACIWQLPSIDYMTVPFARSGLPLAPAPPAILRPADRAGTLRDAHGAVSIHPELRKQNTAVPGAVEQGKSSYLVATVAEDLRRERCAIIVFDPKGDAAEAAVSLVPAERTCTLLDFARPTCGLTPWPSTLRLT